MSAFQDAASESSSILEGGSDTSATDDTDAMISEDPSAGEMLGHHAGGLLLDTDTAGRDRFNSVDQNGSHLPTLMEDDSQDGKEREGSSNLDSTRRGISKKGSKERAGHGLHSRIPSNRQSRAFRLASPAAL